MSRGVETVIGLEVHVRLDTGGKLFCGCRLPHERGSAGPNTSICEVCIGHPGAMPRLQGSAVRYGLALGLALGARGEDLVGVSRFERKHYFYWDLPKNYQTTQIDAPVIPRTLIRVVPEGGDEPFEVVLDRIHLEEDAASKQEDKKEIRVDFNRSGTVLAEIVTEPTFRSGRQAADFLRHLRRVLQWHHLGRGEVADMRCDVNLSVRHAGETHLNPKTELKNVTRLDSLEPVVAHETERLAQILRSGGTFEQETREWDEKTQDTRVLRSKEGESDYWYYVEPDLLDIEATADHIDAASSMLGPDLEEAIDVLENAGFDAEEIFRSILADAASGYLTYRLAVAGLDAKSCRAFGDLLKRATGELEAKRRTESEELGPSEWTSGSESWAAFRREVEPRLDLLSGAFRDGKITPQHLKLLASQTGVLTGTSWSTLKELFKLHGLEEVAGGDELESQVVETLEKVLAENPEQRDAWLAEGDKKLFNFFQGQLMRQLPKGTDGRAVREILGKYRDGAT